MQAFKKEIYAVLAQREYSTTLVDETFFCKDISNKKASYGVLYVQIQMRVNQANQVTDSESLEVCDPFLVLFCLGANTSSSGNPEDL